MPQAGDNGNSANHQMVLQRLRDVEQDARERSREAFDKIDDTNTTVHQTNTAVTLLKEKIDSQGARLSRIEWFLLFVIGSLALLAVKAYLTFPTETAKAFLR